MSAAIELADGQGLEAVSMRGLAAALGARTMTLYSHVASKDGLLDLVVDRVAGEELTTGEWPDDWREALRAIAHRSRAAFLRHPWLVGLFAQKMRVAARGRRLRLGPNALRHLEQSLAAVAPLPLDPRSKLEVLQAIDDFTIGHMVREGGASGVLEWELMQGVEEQGLPGGADFPNLAGLLRAGVPAHDEEDTFERGLTWLLDSIAREAAAYGRSRQQGV